MANCLCHHDLLSKPGRLTDTEYNLIKHHSKKGYEMLKAFEFPWPIAEIVRQHHERLNGSGYPSGISGEEILLGARILGVADVVEAMSSHRPYRPSLGINAALAEISKNKGNLYDPRVVDLCLRMFAERRFSFDKGSTPEAIKSYLVTQNGAGKRGFFELTKRITIGRGKTNDICLFDGKVSRFHAEVSLIDNETVIEDKDGNNGTFVNGESIKKLSLKHGDRIRIGDVLIDFFQESTQSRIASDLSETQSFDAP